MTSVPSSDVENKNKKKKTIHFIVSATYSNTSYLLFYNQLHTGFLI